MVGQEAGDWVSLPFQCVVLKHEQRAEGSVDSLCKGGRTSSSNSRQLLRV